MTIGLLLRHVSARFALALGLFWLGMTVLWIVVDLMLRLEGLLDAGAGFAVKYYLHQIPATMPVTLPTALLLASVFTVVQLARANELVPIMVAGISLRRLSVPFLATSAAAAILLAWVHASVLPRNWATLSEMKEDAEGRGDRHHLVRQAGTGDHVSADSYLHGERLLKGVAVLRVNEDGEAIEEIRCKRAEWDPERELWVLRNGRRLPMENGEWKTEPGPDGTPRRVEIPLDNEGLPLDLELRPADFLARDFRARPLTFSEALRMSRLRPDVAAYRLELYEKFTQPLAPLILVLFGLPLALRASGNRHALVGIGLCLPIIVVFFGITLLVRELGVKDLIPPLAAAVGPVLLFAGTGAALFARIRT